MDKATFVKQYGKLSKESERALEVAQKRGLEVLFCDTELSGRWIGFVVAILGHATTGKGRVSKRFSYAVIAAPTTTREWPVGRRGDDLDEANYRANGGMLPVSVSKGHTMYSFDTEVG